MTQQHDQRLELREAAERLGVHYQTAYRWVRSGRLPAARVRGRYLVSPDELRDFDERRQAPAPPPAPGAQRIQRQAAKMEAALTSGDQAEAAAIARRLVDEGASVTTVLQTIVTPVLRTIGEAWQDGDSGVWVEHRATAIVERIIGELMPNPRGRRRGTAMVAAVAGDEHALPTTMATVALREANWRVHHLGANMPVEELVEFCASHEIDLAVLSITNPNCSVLATDTAGRLRAGGTDALLGGPGRSLEQLVDEANDRCPT